MNNNKCVVELFEGDRVLRKKQTEFLKDKEVWRKKDNFIKLYDGGLDSFLDNINEKDTQKLSGIDCRILFKLIKYISYENGMLTKTGKNDSRYPLTNEDIISITGIRKQTVVRTMQKLVNLSILSRNKYGRNYQYFANPYIFFRGTYINKMLIDMFKNYEKV